MEYRVSDITPFVIDAGFIDFDFLKSLWESEKAAISARFIHTVYGKDLADAMGKAIAESDFTYIDNYFIGMRLELLRLSIYSTFGIEVLIAYVEKKLIEIGAVQTVLRMKKAGMDPDKIKKAVEYAAL
jgi:vacuolar-type H+-ATPase subunit C/Vma6